MKYKPYAYQQHATEHIIDQPYCGLFLEMGLGKTVATLTALNDLMLIDTEKVLVIAPLRVAESTWSNEIEKWDHLRGLTVSKILGSESMRKKGFEERC